MLRVTVNDLGEVLTSSLRSTAPVGAENRKHVNVSQARTHH